MPLIQETIVIVTFCYY